MATPSPDSYSCATGQGIYGGRYNSVPMDVVNNVWTPTKDGNGDILGGSWENLPLDEWCSVAGTQLQGLQDALIAAGFNPQTKSFGTNKTVTATFTPWVGVAVDFTNGDVWNPWGGGHQDSSINGVWHISMERMGSWDIAHMPSDPDAVGYEWPSAYRNDSDFTTFESPSLDTPNDILPDGMPTSRHQYNGVWYDPVRNEVCQARNRIWKFHPGSGQITSQKTYINEVMDALSTNQHLFFDEVTNNIIGYAPASSVDEDNWITLNPDTGDWTHLPNRYAGAARAICRIGRDIMLITDANTYGLLNMDSGVWHSTATLTDNQSYNYVQSMQVCVYVPEWGKVIRQFTNSPLYAQWYLFDPATLTHEAYTPQGLVPPFSAWPGNKVFYYPRRKCVVYITAPNLSDPSIYAMRVG